MLLKLTPSKWEDKWYQWNQELPANESAESKQQAREFSERKIGYRGDLRFSKAEVLDLKQIMGIQPEQKQEESLQTMKKSSERDEHPKEHRLQQDVRAF